MLDLPFFLVALPGADGEESPGFRDRWIQACVPAQLLCRETLAGDFPEHQVSHLSNWGNITCLEDRLEGLEIMYLKGLSKTSAQ